MVPLDSANSIGLEMILDEILTAFGKCSRGIFHISKYWVGYLIWTDHENLPCDGNSWKDMSLIDLIQCIKESQVFYLK
jgi:hypothetical protein